MNTMLQFTEKKTLLKYLSSKRYAVTTDIFIRYAQCKFDLNYPWGKLLAHVAKSYVHGDAVQQESQQG